MAETGTGEWQALVLAQRPWLQALIGRQLSERAAVEDVLQETLAAGVEKEAEREQVGDLRAWLGGVAKRKSQDHLRRAIRRARAHERMGDAGEGAEAPATPLELLVDAERHGRVREAVRGLPERDAALLRMKYGEGRSYAEIGDRLGIGHNAVANGLREARARLRRAVGEGFD